jgi:tetratricopeptide (TPR) repeat protein
MRRVVAVCLLCVIAATWALADIEDDCRQDKDLDLLLRACTNVINRDGNASWAFKNRGHAYYRAIADLDKAVEIDPRYAAAISWRGNAYQRKGDMERAIADYGKAIELDPLYAAPYNNRRDLYSGNGEFERALADYSKAIELDPQYLEPNVGRGYVHEVLGRREEAIADYRRALAVSPYDQYSRNALKRLGAGP